MTRLGLAALLGLALLSLPARAQDSAPEVSAETLLPRAEAGDMAAQTALALAYHDGTGVAQNYATAALWATRAAHAGAPEAQNLLGRYYHGGLGVTQDQAQALRWLGAAAQSGTPQYLHDLGRALEIGADGSTDPAAAAQAYGAAAQAGHMDAMVSLALLHQEGRGVTQDFERARALYETAAQQGHARALNNLGLLYVRGNGVAQNYEQAATLFEAAAQQGLPRALRNLGVMYENGFGVPVDEAYAVELYRQAGLGPPATAETAPTLSYDARLLPLPEEDPELQTRLRAAARSGDPVARFQLGWSLLNTQTPDFAAIAEAAQLFEAAAQAGYGPAMRNLGILYFQGDGVPQDYVLGRMWLTLADQAGQADAPAIMEALSPSMTADQINEAQSRAAAWLEKNS